MAIQERAGSGVGGPVDEVAQESGRQGQGDVWTRSESRSQESVALPGQWISWAEVPQKVTTTKAEL